MSTRNPRLRVFVRTDAQGNVYPGSMVLRFHKPTSGGIWQDITNCVGDCCFEPVYFIVCNTNTNGQAITNISYGDKSLTVDLTAGDCYTIQIPMGTSTVSITNDAESSPGRMTAELVSGSGTVTPACQDSLNTYVFTVTGAHAGDQYIATLESNTSCTTSSTTTTTTTA